MIREHHRYQPGIELRHVSHLLANISGYWRRVGALTERLEVGVGEGEGREERSRKVRLC